MRTTVTLDDDVAAMLHETAHARRVSFKVALNDAARHGLTAQTAIGARPRFVVKPHRSGFLPGVDIGKLNQLVDQLDVEGFIAKTRRPARR